MIIMLSFNTYYPSFNYLYGLMAESVTHYIKKKTLPSSYDISPSNTTINKKTLISKYRAKPEIDKMAMDTPAMYINLIHNIGEGNDSEYKMGYQDHLSHVEWITDLVSRPKSKVNGRSMEFRMSFESVSFNMEFTIYDKTLNKSQELMMWWKRKMSSGRPYKANLVLETIIPKALWEDMCLVGGLEPDIGTAYDLLSRRLEGAHYRLSLKENPGTKLEEIFLSWDSSLILKPDYLVLPQATEEGRARVMRAVNVTVSIPKKMFLGCNSGIESKVTDTATTPDILIDSLLRVNIGVTSDEVIAATVDMKRITDIWCNHADLKDTQTVDLVDTMTETDPAVRDYYLSLSEEERSTRFKLDIRIGNVPCTDYSLSENLILTIKPQHNPKYDLGSRVYIHLYLDYATFTYWKGNVTEGIIDNVYHI